MRWRLSQAALLLLPGQRLRPEKRRSMPGRAPEKSLQDSCVQLLLNIFPRSSRKLGPAKGYGFFGVVAPVAGGRAAAAPLGRAAALPVAGFAAGAAGESAL